MADAFVSATNGHDANVGSLLAPFATIARAMLQVTNGSSIHLRGDRYAEYVVINKSITLHAWENEPVTIQPDAGGNETILIRDTDHVIVDGLHIDSVNTRRGVSISRAHHVTVQHCEIENCYGHAPVERGQGLIISADGICHHVNVWYCHIHHVGGIPSEYGNCHAIYASCPALEIRWCEFDHIDGNGLHFFGAQGGSVWMDSSYCHDNAIGIGGYYGDVLVTNNICRDNVVGLLARANPITCGFYHNTCYNNIRGMDVNGLSDTSVVTIMNNVFAHGDHAFAVGTLVGKVTMINNLRSEMTNPDGIATGYSASTINATFAPVSDDGIEIRPLEGNPAIGKGADIVDARIDRGGMPREFPPTLGAWQYSQPPRHHLSMAQYPYLVRRGLI